MHSRNFMHRDLKPLNILLSKNLHVKISDFGLAKDEDISVSQSKGVGTLRFMAPELFEESDDGIIYTNRVDVYSFGIKLLYIVNDSYPKFRLKKATNGILPELPETIIDWVHVSVTR